MKVISLTGRHFAARFFGFSILIFLTAFYRQDGHLASEPTAHQNPGRDSALYYLQIGKNRINASPDQALEALAKATHFAGQPPRPGCDSVLIEILIYRGKCHGKFQTTTALDSCEHYFQAAYEQAIRSYGQESEAVVKCLNYLAGFYAGKSCYDKSLSLRLQAFQIAEKIPGGAIWRIKLGNNLGLLYLGKGEFQLSEQYLKQAFDLIPGCNCNDYLVLNVHCSYAEWMAASGRFEEAEALMARARRFVQETDSLSLPAFCLTKGRVFRAQSKLDSVVYYDSLYLDQVTRKNLLNPTDIAHANFNLALDFFGLEKWDRCIARLQECIDIERIVFGEKFSLLTLSYQLMARCYTHKNDRDKAEYYLKKALYANNYEGCGIDSLHHMGNGIGVFADLGQLELSRNRLRSALHYFRLAEKTMSAYGDQMIAPQDREGIMKGGRPLLESSLEVACKLWTVTGDSAYLREAFYFTEQSKARTLREAVLATDAQRFAGVPETVIDRDRQLKQEIAACETALQSVSGVEQRRKKEAELFECHRRQQVFTDGLKRQYPNFFKIFYGAPPISIETLRRHLLRSDQELVEYFVGEKQITAFVISRTRFDMKIIPLDFPLADWVGKFIRGIRGDDSSAPDPGLYLDEYLKYGQLLYRHLVAPLSLEAPSTVFVTDGVLGAIPFEALLTEQPKYVYEFDTYPYLLKQHSISYSLSATLLQDMMNKQHRLQPEHPFMAFAPFDQQGMHDLSYMPQIPVGLRSGFGALPFSINEARAGKQYFAGSIGSIKSGKQACKSAFLKTAGSCRILLLPLHGYSDPLVRNNAFLAFYPGNLPTPDSLLFLREVYALELNADLVLLSACETGIGLLANGEGMISLARAFAYAGAKSVVASFWSVETEPTSRVMKKFYAQLAAGMPKDRALQAAKLEYLGENVGDNAVFHPYFWAGMVCFGDTGSILKG